MSNYTWQCFDRWTPYNSCGMVTGNGGGYSTKRECEAACAPQQVPGYEIFAVEKSCNGSYITTPYAHTPRQCAYYCNKELNNCKYFMWDSTKEQQDSTFITDDNCIMFSEIPKDCTEMITTYPASLGSVMYKKSDVPAPSGMY